MRDGVRYLCGQTRVKGVRDSQFCMSRYLNPLECCFSGDYETVFTRTGTRV